MTKQDLIKAIKEISEKIDAQRSALEDLENDMREIDLWNDEIDIDGEINQAAAEAEAITDNLAKVIEAIEDPETEIKEDPNSVEAITRQIDEHILAENILAGLESINAQ